MAVVDIFAWIVLAVLAGSAAAMFFIAGSSLQCLLVLLFLLVKLRIIRFNLFWKCSRANAGDTAIYTDRIKQSHIIRKVLLRQVAIRQSVLVQGQHAAKAAIGATLAA